MTAKEILSDTYARVARTNAEERLRLDAAEALHYRSFHNLRTVRRLAEDPEFKAEYERQREAVAEIDAAEKELDGAA